MAELITTEGGALTTPSLLHEAGQAANRAAARRLFADYRERKAANTRRAQDAALELFRAYLADVAEIPTGDLGGDPTAWAGVTWGLVTGFVKWQLERGYTVASVNLRLSTVKMYAKLAMQAGAIEHGEYTAIRAVTGYRHAEAKHIDQEREARGLRTRTGHKKAAAVKVTEAQARRLKSEHDPDGQGRRDRFLMCLLVDWGLRVSEIAELTVNDLHLDTLCATLHIYRPKVENESTLDLTSTPDTLDAARAYMAGYGAPKSGPLFVGSTRRGSLTGRGMTIRAIHKRVTTLGARVGIDGLGPHDLRHYAATRYGQYKSTRELMDVFGWSSASMAVRYQERAETVRV